jgi:hypothetical protein
MEGRGHAERDRDVWLILAPLMVVAAGLVLWLGRDSSFSTDEIDWLASTPGLDLHDSLQPYNGHLILGIRLAYVAMFNAFGTAYVPFRILGYATVLLVACLMFVFLSRRVGRLAAAAPTLVLLVYGSDANHVLLGNGFGDLFPIATGVGALLCLEREDRLGDLAACALLSAGVATYSVGLAFIGGAAALILLDPARRRRFWVFLVPALLYGAWLVWSRDSGASTDSNVQISNLLLAPSWSANSLAAAGSSLLGLNYPSFGESWGPLVALLALSALAWRMAKGAVTVWLWGMLAIAATLWVVESTAALPGLREPDAARYVFSGSVAVLLVAAEAARGVRLGRRGLAILYAVAVCSIATNVALLRNAGADLRTQAVVSRADLGVVEILDGRLGPWTPPALLPPGHDPAELLWVVLRLTGEQNEATGYMAATREFDSPGYSSAELRELSPTVRAYEDSVLAGTLDLALEPAPGRPAGCRPTGVAPLRLPAGGAILRAGRSGATVQLGRFALPPSVAVGSLHPGSASALAIPVDAAPDPWYLAATGQVSICPLDAGGKA